MARSGVRALAALLAVNLTVGIVLASLFFFGLGARPAFAFGCLGAAVFYLFARESATVVGSARRHA